MATNTKVIPPTHEDFDKLKRVHSEADPSWRHGCYMYEVYHREVDDTYWAVNYNLSGDGETNGLREGECDIDQVKRVVETVEQVGYVQVATSDERTE